MNYQTISLIVVWCERRDLLCSHRNGDIFARKLTWYFIGVHIINVVLRQRKEVTDA